MYSYRLGSAVTNTLRTNSFLRRWASQETKDAASSPSATKTVGLWSDPKFWGGMGALAGWGMSGAAIYDATQQGPEVISLNMTGVLLVYSSLFARWAFVVKPQNLLLAGCHIANIMAQTNQMRRGLEHKMASGQDRDVQVLLTNASYAGIAGAAAILAGPRVRQALVQRPELGILSTVAAADAGPFTVHVWAPMSKWMISGASFFEWDRPTDRISLPQYAALTLTGFFFTRYALLVTPINYTLCSVNIALFLSSGYHLGRKIKADYIDDEAKE
jgi:Mitochondrial pyruvate carriers